LSFTWKIRLGLFVAAVVTAVALLFLFANLTWRGFHDLGEQLTTIHLESFRIADRFQHFVLELNGHVRRFALTGDDSEWESFIETSRDLDGWIDAQRRKVTSAAELSAMNALDRAFDDYRAAAVEISGRVRAPDSNISIRDFATFEAQSRELLGIGFELASAHRTALTVFLDKTSDRLHQLQVFFVVTVSVLLLLLGAMAFTVYRSLIAPLQMKLVQSQELVERNEKLASLGMLAAGVAHEIRNPLTAVKARIFTLQKRLSPGTPAVTDLEVISQEINRLDQIVRGVLQFARPDEPALAAPSAVDALLQEVRVLLEAQLAASSIKFVVGDIAPVRVRIDPAQIKQVLINLVQNAAEAIGRDGTITLSARSDVMRLDHGRTNVLVIEVADDGPGIAPEVEKRLFDPFFSTKDTGTGLGLAIASRLVAKHGGALQYRTEPGRGSTFGIVLPHATSL
jgi:signal transduction histidine kinase